MKETMGQIIRRLRRDRGFTQEELAEHIGVTFQAVSKWENDTGMPDISQVLPLASVTLPETDACCTSESPSAALAMTSARLTVSPSETAGTLGAPICLESGISTLEKSFISPPNSATVSNFLTPNVLSHFSDGIILYSRSRLTSHSSSVEKRILFFARSVL